MINADGSGLRRLTRNTVADSDPAWSPEGQKIAWSRSDGTGATSSCERRRQRSAEPDAEAGQPG